MSTSQPYKAVTIGQLRAAAKRMAPPSKTDGHTDAELSAMLDLDESLRLAVKNHESDNDGFVVNVLTTMADYIRDPNA